MKKENRNNISEQIESFRLEEDLNELEESYMKIHRFKKGQSYKKKDKQNFNTKISLFKTYKEFQI